jgi:hypothetical protein
MLPGRQVGDSGVLTAFVGVNMFQAVFTGLCPAASGLKTGLSLARPLLELSKINADPQTG